MARLTVEPAQSFQGSISVPGDKSISHRALLVGAIAKGQTEVTGCLRAADVETTRKAIEALGVSVSQRGDRLVVEGKGLRGLSAPSGPLDLGNSGTTARLLLGILAGQSFPVTLTGDASLSKRPMARVTEPLSRMGAKITGPSGLDRLPLTIQGGKLSPIRTTLEVASAQAKSALLLAGLYAEGPSTVMEPVPTRDHTERMLAYFAARVTQAGNSVTLTPSGELTAKPLRVPGDISSAAFFFVAAAILPKAKVTVKGVGLNPTRVGILKLLERMGASVQVADIQGGFEPEGDVTIFSSSLKGISVGPSAIPGVIDELPVFMVAATQATGRTVIEGAGELRVKETDRIHSMAANLTAMGAKMTVEKDNIVIDGPAKLHGAAIDSFQDHRTAMACAVAGLAASSPVTIQESQWVDISFPTFWQGLAHLTGR